MSSTPPTTALRSKPTLACNFCRSKKVRCHGGCPCKQCLDHGEKCILTPSRRGKRNDIVRPPAENMRQRLERLESALGTFNATSASVNAVASTAPPGEVAASPLATVSDLTTQPQDSIPSYAVNQRPLEQNVLTHPVWSSTRISANVEPSARYPSSGSTAQLVSTQGPRSPTCDNALTENTTVSPVTLDVLATDTLPTSQLVSNSNRSQMASFNEHLNAQENSSLHSDEMSNWEYNGPRCFLSLCSQPGMAWVETRVKIPDVKDSIMRFAKDLTRQMKAEPGLWLQSKTRAPEPSTAVSWLYVNAFFEKAIEAQIGILDRKWFNTTLTTHHSKPERFGCDPAWYALRNTVYAFGCRIVTSRTQSYSNAVSTSLALFENALSVQSDILQLHSSIISVRALTLMAYYSEGIGSPHLEYMLISDAMRLAISKGLHRQPAVTWNLSQQEIFQRNMLFWSIYSLDRQISSRSGRPPTIDEDDVSCELPHTSPSSDPSEDIVFSTICIQLHQILSQAYKRLSSARALRQTIAELVRTITELDHEINEFKRSVREIIALEEPLDGNLFTSPHRIPMQQQLLIYFLYYGVLFEIHGHLMLPWFDSMRLKQTHAFRPEVERSCAIVTNTARTAIQASRLVQLDATTPALLAWYIPYRAVIHLFTNILLDPKAETIRNDLTLMQVAVGYASRLELATDCAFSSRMVSDLRRFAAAAVEGAQVSNNTAAQARDSEAVEMVSNYMQDHGPPNDDITSEHFYFPHDLDPSLGIDMELWSTLIPVGNSEDVDLNIFAAT